MFHVTGPRAVTPCGISPPAFGPSTPPTLVRRFGRFISNIHPEKRPPSLVSISTASGCVKISRHTTTRLIPLIVAAHSYSFCVCVCCVRFFSSIYICMYFFVEAGNAFRRRRGKTVGVAGSVLHAAVPENSLPRARGRAVASNSGANRRRLSVGVH